MKPVLLLIGHTGIFGKQFNEMYSEMFEIIGVSRGIKHEITGMTAITGDVGVDMPRIWDDALKVHGRIDHVIQATSECKLVAVDSLDRENAIKAFNSNLISIFELGQLMDRDWKEGSHSLTVVSSLSGMNYYPNQLVYGTLKASQIHASKYLASYFKNTHVRVNSVAPNTFPRLIPTNKVCEKVYGLINSRVSGVNILISGA